MYEKKEMQVRPYLNPVSEPGDGGLGVPYHLTLDDHQVTFLSVDGPGLPDEHGLVGVPEEGREGARCYVVYDNGIKSLRNS